jgi:hypothetical protein
MTALKFVMHDALGGGGPRSLRSDNLGKTHAAALLRLWIEVPDDVAACPPPPAGSCLTPTPLAVAAVTPPRGGRR